jgi:hypothetical protein
MEGGGGVQFDDAIVCGDVDDATAELVGEGGECLQVLMFMSKRF